MALRAVFFDLDGTLLDTADDLADALNKVLEEERKPILSIEEARTLVSEGALALIKRGFSIPKHIGLENKEVNALRQRLLDFYALNLAEHTTVFPGIAYLIHKLAEHGISWGVVTNKPKLYAEPLMAHFEFVAPPICVLSPEDVIHRKPHRESLDLACKIAACEIHEAIYIGDHKRDIDCGKNAGMPTISAAYGYVPENENALDWHADFCVRSASALWPLIQTYL